MENVITYDMPERPTKPTILIFIAYYLPGYKAGGILRTLVNTINQLGNDFEFKVVTQDRDLGDREPYQGIYFNQWNQLGNATVYHISADQYSFRRIERLIAETRYDILYLNSLFDRVFTIKVMMLSRLGKLPCRPLILAPRGELDASGLKLKKHKKRIFIQLAQYTALYRNVFWHASTFDEAQNIALIMKVPLDRIHIAQDLPKRLDEHADQQLDYPAGEGVLRLVFLSRIAREKNLDYALQVLKQVNVPVCYDIYGPVEDEGYWEECKKLIVQLPGHIKVTYRHSVEPDKVMDIFGRYDLFFFPTTGESYGHVIAESLMAGTPVLVSSNTPWRDLEKLGLGWEADLKRPQSFVQVMERYSSLPLKQRMESRERIRQTLKEKLLDPVVAHENRMLFLKHFAMITAE